jgi:GNAT superfamily N-acetyltransferase
VTGFEVAAAETDADLEAVVEVRERAAPDLGADVPQLRHQRAFWHDLLLLVARLDGEPVGSAFAGVFPGADEEPHASADVTVVPDHRGRGVGGDLLARISTHARSLGKEAMIGEAREGDTRSIAWLARRGFEEIERQKAVELDLAAVELSAAGAPPGIRIVSRAEVDLEPLLPEMYEAAGEAGGDVPGLDAGFSWTFDEWRAFEIDRPSRDPSLGFLALDGTTVVGFASIDVIGGRASNGLTGVRRAYRRRGIARALKLAQIRAAKEAGFTSLLTESEETNEPMRRLNESLGYRPVPGMVVVRGSLA